MDTCSKAGRLDDRKMLVDANILLYAVGEDSPFHAVGLNWIEEAPLEWINPFTTPRS